MSRLVKIINLKQTSYARSLAIQEQIRRRKLESLNCKSGEISDYLVLVEHDPVYTIGLRSKEYSEDLEIRLRMLGADFHQVHRGGLITFHGPGQLVAYPILNLKNSALGECKTSGSVKCFVDGLEKTIVKTCEKFGVETGTTSDTGVWVEGERKIAAIGETYSFYDDPIYKV